MAKSLPGFIELLKETWALFRGKFKSLFLLYLIETLFAILVTILIGLVTASTVAFKLIGVATLGSLTTDQVISLATEFLPHLGLLLLCLGLTFGFIDSLFSAGKVKTLEVTKSTGDLLSFGKTKMLRVFVGGLLVTLVCLGGFWLFLIPGLIYSFLLSFVIYELVLSDQKLIVAIKHSVAVVWANFWPLLGRSALLFLLVVVMRSIFSRNGDQQAMNFLAWIVEFLTSWFSLVFSYVLYTHAKSLTPKSATISLNWLIIPAILGWVLFATSVTAGAKFLKSRGVIDDFGTKLEQMIRQDIDYNLPGETPSQDSTT